MSGNRLSHQKAIDERIFTFANKSCRGELNVIGGESTGIVNCTNAGRASNEKVLSDGGVFDETKQKNIRHNIIMGRNCIVTDMYKKKTMEPTKQIGFGRVKN